jgi:hypothetical protein
MSSRPQASGEAKALRRFEVVFFVDAATLREAKRAARDLIKHGYRPVEFIDELIDGLREVKPRTPHNGGKTNG